MHFHAVMLDECGDEFGVGVEAPDRAAAYDKLREDYPENRGIVQVETPEDTQRRDQERYAHIMRGGDWDEEGRPIMLHPEYDDEDDDEDYPEHGWEGAEFG